MSIILVIPMTAVAHHPNDHGPVHVWPQVDVIGPLGNRLPPSYRRRYNRPSYLGGKIAHAIAPSSQEAMAWHRADHMGLYDNNGIKGCLSGERCPPRRVVLQYFYPKPWEVLPVGPRRASPRPTRESTAEPIEAGYLAPPMNAADSAEATKFSTPTEATETMDFGGMIEAETFDEVAPATDGPVSSEPSSLAPLLELPSPGDS